MITTKLRDKTLDLLRNRPAWKTYTQIAEDTKIPVGWIKEFSRGTMNGPDVNRIETLYEHLAQKPIDI